MSNHLIITDDVLELWECEHYVDIFHSTPRPPWHNSGNGIETIDPKDGQTPWRSDLGEKEVCWIPVGCDTFEQISKTFGRIAPDDSDYQQVRHVQIIKYPKDGLFHWHKDLADSHDRATALITLMTPDAGGNLMVEDLTIPNKQGRMVSFNNSTERWHCVTPVLHGDRYVLALWLGDGTTPPR